MHRRSVLGALGGGVVAGITGCLGSGEGDGDQSTPAPVVNREVPSGGDGGGPHPQFQGSAEHTGRLGAAGPTGPVTTFWRRTPSRYDHSQPVVDGDRLYVSFSGSLIRLDRATGEHQWTTDVGHDGASTPAVYDDSVYVTVWNGGADVDRGVAAVDAETGAVEWRGVTDADVTTSPTVTADGVFVGGGYETASVTAFDHDGTERWRRTLGEYASTPAAADGIVVYGAGTARVVAYDAVSGDRLWQHDTDGETTATPTIADGRVLLGTRAGTLYALDVRDGTAEWTTTLPGPVRRSVAVADGYVVVPTERGLVAVDTEGSHQWTADAVTGATAPVLAGETVYLGEGATVRALSLTDGGERWSFETRERTYTDVVLRGVRAAPTVTNGVVVVATQAGDVYALGEESGTHE